MFQKPDTRNSKNKLTKTSVTNTSNKTDPEALKKTVVPTKTQAIKHQVKTHNPAPASQHTRVTRSSRLQASKEIVKTSTVTEAYVGADVLAVKADARRRGGKPTDLSSKMTASAAAKAKVCISVIVLKSFPFIGHLLMLLIIITELNLLS